MNKFKKYCPNVWIAECVQEYKKGEIIELETKHGKTIECEVYNLIAKKGDVRFYSIVRLDEPYAQRKAEKYRQSAENHVNKSQRYYEASNEGREFLILGEPIKAGHHSEKRHRALIERNWNRMGKSVEFADKAEESKKKADYWDRKSEVITLANPESLEYFAYKLEEAKKRQQGLKNGTIPKEHSFSMAYATKEVKELIKKVENAKALWG